MKPTPIYRSDGEWVALLQDDCLYDTRGEWIGWLHDGEVYTRDGEYVGYLSEDQRILRTRVRPRRSVRAAPSSIPPVRVPAKVPLAPLFSELPWEVIDVLEEEPRIFVLISDLKPDWEG